MVLKRWILRKWRSGQGGHRVSEETWGYVGTPAYVGLHKVTEMLFQFEQMGIFIL